MTYQEEADKIVARYGSEAWRYLGWSADGVAAITRWKARAIQLGMEPGDVDRLWAQVELDQMLAERPFNALREAERRLVQWRRGEGL